jgi:hypothetical protein
VGAFVLRVRPVPEEEEEEVYETDADIEGVPGLA